MPSAYCASACSRSSTRWMLIRSRDLSRRPTMPAGRRRMARAEARFLLMRFPPPLEQPDLLRRSDRARAWRLRRRATPCGRCPAAAPSCTTMGMPRARASIATWLVGLPRNSARPPPRDQSISRNRDGGRSSAQTTAPLGIFSASPSPPRKVRSTRSRRSAKIRRSAPGDIRRRPNCSRRSAPSSADDQAVSRRRSLGNCREDRIEEILVLQQRDLKFKDLRGLAAGRVGQLGDLLGSLRRAPREAPSLLVRACQRHARCSSPASTRTNGPCAKPIEAVLPRYAKPAMSARMFTDRVSGKSVATRSTSAATAASRVLARRLDLDDAVARRAQRHHLGDALGVDPIGRVGRANRKSGPEISWRAWSASPPAARACRRRAPAARCR